VQAAAKGDTVKEADEILREHEDPELPSGIGSKDALRAIRAAQLDALKSALAEVQRAREEGETDMRQVRNWIEGIVEDHGLGK
jgi:hypothetical protein